MGPIGWRSMDCTRVEQVGHRLRAVAGPDEALGHAPGDEARVGRPELGQLHLVLGADGLGPVLELALELLLDQVVDGARRLQARQLLEPVPVVEPLLGQPHDLAGHQHLPQAARASSV